MKVSNIGVLSVVGPLVVLVIGGCSAIRPCDSVACMTDAKTTAAIETRLSQREELGPPGTIQVQTIDHVVYLNGAVSTGLQRAEAESLASQVMGVKLVVNSIDAGNK
jgi:osmotically-inducible protein OsmY